MFNNYRLKIDGEIFPEKYIADGSYQVISEPIILNDYLDGDYNRHIIKAPQDKLSISLALPKMLGSDYAIAKGFFQDTMSIQYYDPKSDTYKTGTFTIIQNEIPAIHTTINGYVIYASQQIKLIRKVSE